MDKEQKAHDLALHYAISKLETCHNLSIANDNAKKEIPKQDVEFYMEFYLFAYKHAMNVLS